MGRNRGNFEQTRWTESYYGVPPKFIMWQGNSSSGDDDE
jgi:hypothetical protein